MKIYNDDVRPAPEGRGLASTAYEAIAALEAMRTSTPAFPSRVLVALDRAVVTGRFLRTVHEAVRKRTRPDAKAPNIIRIE